MMEKFKRKIKESEEIEAYVHYVYDIDKWESRLYPLPKIKPLLEFKSKNEIYKLDKTAYFLNGKPVFLLLRGIPFSLEIEESNQVLKIKGYSADEIEAKINSIYVNHVFRRGAMGFRDYLSWLLSLIVVALTTYIITYFSVSASFVNQNVPVNATMGV